MAVVPEKPAGFAELSKNKRVLAWCLLIFILPINFGYELALVGNILAIPASLDRFGTTTTSGIKEIPTQDQQILNASTTVGIVLAAYCTGFISDIIGRRMVVICGCVLCITGIIVQGFSNSILKLFGGKLISTVGYGLGHALGPVYVAEIAPDALRGGSDSLILINTMIVIGQWSCALVGYGGSFIKNAKKPGSHYGKFNGPRHNVEETLAIMEATLEKEKALSKGGASYFDCFRGTNLRRTTIVCMVYLTQQFAGAQLVVGYLSYFFTIAGVGNPIGIAQVCYSIQLLGNILIGGLGVPKTNQSALTAMVALMALWGFIFQLSIGASGYAVGGETESPRLRQKTYFINVMSNTAAACLVTQLMPFLINPSNANLGGKVAFVFFGPSLLCSIYLYFCFPEMKGRSYLELENMFQKRLPTRAFKNYHSEIETVEVDDGENVAVVLKD
ncbi:maltose permease [Colletotrichum phormii]|uniref:Maltose permease n=1 Tax=Colletotrichum phormii TaxID=359342 RepID=A0AAI9ZFY5_9PEZI|nr:maltose permease [Colletotrichum phormii]KAK1623825.1 maltose permease [Colletotrichum phormii]